MDGQTTVALVMLALGSMMGGFGVWFPSYAKWHTGAYYVCELYQKREAKYHLQKTKKVPFGAESFSVGKNREFIVPSPAPILFYRFGRPVLQYVVNKARPRHAKIEPESKVVIEDPPTKGGKRTADKDAALPDTESRSVNLFFRRHAIKQMIQATKGVDLKAAIPFVIITAIAAFFIAYVIFLQVHPGFYPNPPPGYEYKAFPIPTNTTVVTG